MKLTKEKLKQIIREELDTPTEQATTAPPERWEEIFAGVISDKWWMAYDAATRNRHSRESAKARKELEKAIKDSGVLKTITDQITSLEKGLPV